MFETNPVCSNFIVLMKYYFNPAIREFFPPYKGKNGAFGIFSVVHSPYERKRKMHIFSMTHFFAISYYCN